MWEWKEERAGTTWLQNKIKKIMNKQKFIYIKIWKKKCKRNAYSYKKSIMSE